MYVARRMFRRWEERPCLRWWRVPQTMPWRRRRSYSRTSVVTKALRLKAVGRESSSLCPRWKHNHGPPPPPRVQPIGGGRTIGAKRPREGVHPRASPSCDRPGGSRAVYPHVLRIRRLVVEAADTRYGGNRKQGEAYLHIPRNVARPPAACTLPGVLLGRAKSRGIIAECILLLED